ncbi:unnamed protein product [Effrenium voratum]|nr:unnamed protein product [Effrenium voratum]
MALLDGQGQPAVGSKGLWLDVADFVAASEVSEAELQYLCFPKDWPGVYSSSGLRALIGKKGRLPARRVAVAGPPLPEQREGLAGVDFLPLQSFANAEKAAARLPAASVRVVRGWAVYAVGSTAVDAAATGTFVAEKYWWNERGGQWVDFTPRPEGWTQLLLAEAEGSVKEPQALSRRQAEFGARLLSWRFPELFSKLQGQPAKVEPAKVETKKGEPAKVEPAKSEAPKAVAKKKPHKGIDYSKWSNIVDSDEDEPPKAMDEDVGVKDLAEVVKGSKQPPIPDFLLGCTNGGGGTNCLTSLLKMLDGEQTQETAHQLAQVFGRGFHSAMLDSKRQDFYRCALEALPSEVFVVVLGLGSALPLLRAAANPRFRGLLVESSASLAALGRRLLEADAARTAQAPFAVAVAELTDPAALASVLASALASASGAQPGTVALLTERMAHDLLSNGIVPCCVAAHRAVRQVLPAAELKHIPQTVELLAAPAEIRSDRLHDFDIRPFNALRHTSSNDKADFWWWPVRMDTQQNTTCSILGPAKTLCGFDFARSPEITMEEVRRPLKLQATSRGRCNCAAVWWVARCEKLEYSTRPRLADQSESDRSERSERDSSRSEWKQAIHYLGGETAVFPGDTVELLVSITPKFTFRMLQQSPMSVEAPNWVQAPSSTKFSATLPVLPYHFLMMTDLERLEVYQRAIRAAVRQAAQHNRRVRVLDAGCGIGLLGLTAALEGDGWERF